MNIQFLPCYHCVVSYLNNKNELILISFGGVYEHMLFMKYKSIFNNNNNNNNNNIVNNKWTKYHPNNYLITQIIHFGADPKGLIIKEINSNNIKYENI